MPRYSDGTFGASYVQFCPAVVEEGGGGSTADASNDLPADELKRIDQQLATLRQELLAGIHRNNAPAQPQNSIGEIIAAVEAIDRMRSKNEPQQKDNAPDLVGRVR